MAMVPRVSLGFRPGESFISVAALFWYLIDLGGDHSDHNFIWHQEALIHILFSFYTKGRVPGYFIAQQISGRYMPEAVGANNIGTLGALATTRRTKQDKIKHKGIFVNNAQK
jgi:hypothetical protein